MHVHKCCDQFYALSASRVHKKTRSCMFLWSCWTELSADVHRCAGRLQSQFEDGRLPQTADQSCLWHVVTLPADDLHSLMLLNGLMNFNRKQLRARLCSRLQSRRLKLELETRNLTGASERRRSIHVQHTCFCRETRSASSLSILLHPESWLCSRGIITLKGQFTPLACCAV